ncbi:hypothetical protein GOV05_04775 [Candidatus Woesearchaeota archaeon]|nr:hypothetical protein [Candidatus Woesearchaeota archaeon]
MEKITTKAELIERLKDAKAVEEKVKKKYSEDASAFTNFDIVNKIREIRNDEIKHIGMLTELIKMLSKPDSK